MPIVVSKVEGGTIKFTATSGATAGTPKEFGCQFTSAAVTPGDGGGTTASEAQYVLCGDRIPADASGATGKGDKLDFTVISDHNTIDGIVAFSWEHRDEAVKFSYVPNGAASHTWAGVVTMQPLTVGGEVKGDLRITGSLEIIALTPPQGFGKGYLPTTKQLYPGVQFPSNAQITASTQAMADKLINLGYWPIGYVDSPLTLPAKWSVPGDKFEIEDPANKGTYLAFHWDGAKWAPGAVT